MSEQIIKKPSSEIISVSVPSEIYQWYVQHPEVNRSKVFQDASLDIMYPKKIGIPSHINLIYLLNFVVGVCIMLVASTIQFQAIFGFNWYFIIGVVLLGAVLALASIFTFFKDRKERKKHSTTIR